jgi:quercetin dioxygenase-like cupin family protein
VLSLPLQRWSAGVVSLRRQQVVRAGRFSPTRFLAVGHCRDKKVLAPLLLLVCILGSVLGSCGGSDGVRSPGVGVKDVQRQFFQTVTPDKAPGETLGLSRVVIPAGKDIAAHTHPGAQLAVITEGTLTYSVLRGEVKIARAAGTGSATTETVKAGQSVDLNPGDSLIETPGMVHTARNGGKSAVVIYLTSLFPDGAPASNPAQ